MRRLTVGAIGARTTAFKTVRFDEITLQKYGISTETLDLSSVISRVRNFDNNDSRIADRAERLRNYTNWGDTPDSAFNTHVKLSLVLDEIIEEFDLDTLAIRCWLEQVPELGIAPCVVVSELNDRLIPCACEVDVCNAVAMYALRLASGRQATCLDWNNNYGDEPNKCILFHCGPVPQTLMVEKGEVVDHPMFAKALGSGCSWGPNVGRIAATDMTFSSCKTENGKLSFFIGEGDITSDEIAKNFFGCAGVAEIDNLQHKLLNIGQLGYRHHVSLTPGKYNIAIREAFERYLGYTIDKI